MKILELRKLGDTVRLTVYWDIILGHNIAISGPIGGPQSPESHE